MSEKVFSRCTYEFFQKGMTAPEVRTYILRSDHANPDDACMEIADRFEFEAPDGCDVRITRRKVIDPHRGEFFCTRLIEYINEAEELVASVGNFKSDRLYTFDELVANPELLPDGNAEDFMAYFAACDAAKSQRHFQ